MIPSGRTSQAEDIDIEGAYHESESVATTAVHPGTPIDPEAGTPPPEKVEDPFFVTIKGREHLSSQSWSKRYRWWLTALSGMLVLNASKFSSRSDLNLLTTARSAFASSERPSA